MKIVFFSNVLRVHQLFLKGQERLKKENSQLEVELILLNSDSAWNKEAEEKLAGADVSICQWMGSGMEHPFLTEASQFLRKMKQKHLFLVDKAKEGEVLSGGFTEEEAATAKKYFRYDGAENIYNCLLWLGKSCGGDFAPAEPELLPWHGIWHPEWRGNCQDFEGYCRAHVQPDRMTVGVIFYRTEWLGGDFAYHKVLVDEIEAQGMNVIAVFTNSMNSGGADAPSLSDAVEKYFFRDGKPTIDVLLSTMKFSLKASGTPISLLQKLNVPILESYTVLSSVEEWEAAETGLNPREVSISVSLPELDGVIHAAPIAAKVKDAKGSFTYQALPERIKLVVEKARHWALLKHKKNADKRIALILHNYPASNANIGSAAGLDSMESTCVLLQALADAGYKVEKLYESAELLAELSRSVTNDGRFLNETQLQELYGRLDIKQYKAFFAEKSKKMRETVERVWGRAPGDILNSDEEIFVPGLLNGNIFLTIQPVRGFGDDPEKILHSSDLPPTHQYLGYYQWLRDVWQADAVIHLGTHGSLEWLPGKGTALSADCFPDAALGWLPNIYPYWMTVAGEGLQAKRRGSACLISYLSPPMQLAGSFAEIEELEHALDEYEHFREVQPDNLETAEKMVREKVKNCDFAEEIVEGEDFAEYAGELHNYISELANSRIQSGMHVLGRAPEGEELLEYVLGVIGNDNGEVPSIYNAIAKQSELTDAQVKEQARALLMEFADKAYQAEEIEALLKSRSYNEDAQQALLSVLQLVAEKVVPGLKDTTQEIGNILAALRGEYIAPGAAGAITNGGADLLPTGRNFYGLDPRSIPSPAAWEMGMQLADELLARYIKEEGHYPESVGLVLWSGSNMRSHGQCIAEFLYLMGLRPVWQGPSHLVKGLEIMALDELKRPRIDVTGRISGLFRDSMPDAVKWLNSAASIIGALEEDEEQNYIRKHIKADAAWLAEKGEDDGEAWARASYRIFGNPPGCYGAGVAGMLESKQWESDKDIEEVYTQHSGYAYGADGQPLQYEPELFKRRLAEMDITVKNEDNQELNMFSSDDFSAYHGGMVAAVRSITGKAPKAYMTNNSGGRKVAVRTVEEEAKRIFRSETMNPKYIEGMQKHGYKGAMELANRLVHSYQWDATAGIMDDAMYEKLAEKYTLDEGMQEWMRDVNPWALSRMTETLLEADKRGLWKARPETKQELIELYLNIEGEMEERADNE